MAADRSSTVKIMTQNMDDGTDLTYIIGALTTQGATQEDVANAVDLTYAELQATNFPRRAAALASVIAAQKPDLLALQEASVWTAVVPASNPSLVQFDLIALLQSALRAAGTPYDLVTAGVVNDLALPGNNVALLRLTDRNALLIRSDLRPPAFKLSDVHARIYKAALPFAGLQVHAGWIEAMVHDGNKQFRLVNTHLQTPILGVSAATDIQVLQADELIHTLRNSTIPVVICGDFNSDATASGPIDITPTVGLIATAGYFEVWSALHASGPSGLTWPLFLEDGYPPPPFFAPSSPWLPPLPFERIDLFFSQGMTNVSIERVLAPVVDPAPDPAFSMPPFGSDHAGVVAVFRPVTD
jgi:endonuclease/exonuclease/phosphatase family metal-dependent hydrolase